MAPTRSSTSEYEFCVEKFFYDQNANLVTYYECAICEGTVGGKSDFPRHMERHNRSKLFFCTVPNCTHTEGFLQKSNLLIHIGSVHEGKRHSCPHLWKNKAGKMYPCTHSYSDGSGLIRHRSTEHGFDAGDDEAKILIPTPVGQRFPNSKYARRNKRKAEAEAEDLDALPGQTGQASKRAKRSKRSPAPARPARPSSRRTSKKKAAPKNPVPAPEAQIDYHSMYTLPTSGPSSPESCASTTSDWDFVPGCSSSIQSPMQSQSASGMGAPDLLADALACLPSTTSAQPGNVDLESLFSPEAQTALVNNWAYGPQTTTATALDFDFDFNFNFDFDLAAPCAPLPLPVFRADGTVDPRMLSIPPVVEQTKMVNAGLTPSPSLYYWGGAASPGSSRESTASPDLMMFNAEWPQWVPSPEEAQFNAYSLQ